MRIRAIDIVFAVIPFNLMIRLDKRLRTFHFCKPRVWRGKRGDERQTILIVAVAEWFTYGKRSLHSGIHRPLAILFANDATFRRFDAEREQRRMFGHHRIEFCVKCSWIIRLGSSFQART